MRKKKKKCYQSKSSKDDVILPTDFDLCKSIKRKEKKNPYEVGTNIS